MTDRYSARCFLLNFGFSRMPILENGGGVNTEEFSQGVIDIASSSILRHLSKPIKLPWENHPVLSPKRPFSSVVSELGPSAVGMRDFAQGVGRQCSSEPVPAAPNLEQSLKRAKMASMVVSPDEMRYRAMSLIKVMIDADRSTTRLAMQVDAEEACPRSACSSLRDALSGKATATIYKRTQSMWGLFSWARLHDGGTGLTLNEGRVYRYLCFMRDSKKGATSGEALLQSIRFFHAVLVFLDLDLQDILSARVRGVAKEMFASKPLLRQARALHVNELRALEDAVLDEKSPHVVCIAGYLLFCVMAVCRFSDPMFAIDFRVSRHNNTVLIEAGTSVHKTAHSSEKKRMLLPLLALGHVFRHDKSWAERWFRTLVKQGDMAKRRYVLPAYSEQSNRWLSRRLHDLICLRCTACHGLTTHGLKTTLLSWVTLFDVLDYQQRRVLGHHVDVGLASPLTYGRDNITPLLVKIAVLLDQINRGIHDPDWPRVERLDRQLELQDTLDDLDQDHQDVVYGPVPQPAEDVEVFETASQTEDDLDTAMDDNRVLIPASKADGTLMQHRISGVLHFIGLDEKFVCGRAINSFYEMVDSDLGHEWPMCQQCRRFSGEEAVRSFVDL